MPGAGKLSLTKIMAMHTAEFCVPLPAFGKRYKCVWINQSYFKASSHPWHKHDSKKLRQTSTSEMEGEGGN